MYLYLFPDLNCIVLLQLIYIAVSPMQQNLLNSITLFFIFYFFCLSNLRILQKSTSTTASGAEWQEKALCLGSADSCGSTLVGHILGFGEDELG